MSKPKILVTGAAGFIGARVVERLNQDDIQLISVDRSHYFTERKEHRSLKFGEIVDRGNLFEWLDEAPRSLRAIIHLGACTDTSESDENYLRKTNLEYTQKLWRYCARNNIQFLYASSGATYGMGENGYVDNESEINSLKPLNLYGQSKQDFDIWALQEEKKGHTPPLWSGFKFFNVYGFGERHKKGMSSVVVQAFDQINNTGQVKLFRSHRPDYRDGEQMRDFIYVQDVVDVLMFALEKPIQRGIFNLGTGQARTFLDLVKGTFAAMDRPENIRFVDTPEKFRDQYQYFTEATMDKLKSEGYPKSFTSLEDGIQQYVSRLKKCQSD